MAEHILIVEDEDSFRDSLKLELEEAGYRVSTAASGLAAVQMAAREHYDLIVCDVRLPGMSGLDTLSSLSETQPCARRIVITGYASSDTPVTALKMKVDDYLLKPFTAQDFRASVRAALEAAGAQASREREAVGLRGAMTRLVRSIHRESRLPHLAGHSERVANLCLGMARELGFSHARTQTLYLAGLLHDIGLADLPPRLLEESLLEPQELELYRAHPGIARELLEPFSDLREVGLILLHHHEKWDGSGYPRGLRGPQIPLESRILALAEALDSMLTARPRRRPPTLEEALKRVEEETGHAFDPDLAHDFVRLVRLGCGAEELPIGAEPVAPQGRQVAQLLHMSEAYREVGNFELAGAALEEAEQLSADSPEDAALWFQVRAGGILLSERAGDLEGARARAGKLLEQARASGLAYVVGLALLELAGLGLRQGPLEAVEPWLLEARERFTIWESGYDLARTELLLACCHSAQGSPDLTESFPRFVECLARGHGSEALQLHREQARSLLLGILESRRFEQETPTLIARGGPGALQLLEDLMDCPDLEVRLQVLDLLACSPERRARALLSQARLAPLKAVSEKAAGLLEGRPQEARELGLQVFLLGPMKVAVGATPLPEEDWPTRKIRNLFACLVSRRGEPLSEDRLMSLFWEQSGEKARHSMHNSISQIRRVLAGRLGPAARRAVINQPDGYVFRQDFPCWVDLEDFNEHLQRGRYLAGRGRWEEALPHLQQVERLYRGEFMQGVYEEWCEDFRLKALTGLLEALAVLAGYFFERGKPEVSADYWRRVLARDNCHEDAYLGLMRCHLQQGRPGEAIKVYHQCGQILKKELNLSPPPRMVELYLQTVRSDSVPSPG